MEETKALKQALVLSHVILVFLLHNPTNVVLRCFVPAPVWPLILHSISWAVDDVSFCLSLALYYVVCVFGMNSAWYAALWRRNTHGRETHKHRALHMISKSFFFLFSFGAERCMSVHVLRRHTMMACVYDVMFAVYVHVCGLYGCARSVYPPFLWTVCLNKQLLRWGHDFISSHAALLCETRPCRGDCALEASVQDYFIQRP